VAESIDWDRYRQIGIAGGMVIAMAASAFTGYRQFAAEPPPRPPTNGNGNSLEARVRDLEADNRAQDVQIQALNSLIDRLAAERERRFQTLENRVDILSERRVRP